MTNISSGKLGAKIVDELIHKKHDVVFIHPRGSALPKRRDFRTVVIDVVADSTDEVFEAMKEWVPQVDVVIHSMAVSDFGFNRDNPVTLKSNDPEGFIEYMRANIKINPKIISFVKKWNPSVKLIGFKFEVGKSLDELLNIAKESLEKNNADLIVANDKEEMAKRGRHIAYLVGRKELAVQAEGKEDIACKLTRYLKGLEK